MTDINTSIDRYIAIWNETDAKRRQDLIAQTWTEDATYVDPPGRHRRARSDRRHHRRHSRTLSWAHLPARRAGRCASQLGAL
jgi:hypothetical protein